MTSKLPSYTMRAKALYIGKDYGGEDLGFSSFNSGFLDAKCWHFAAKY